MGAVRLGDQGGKPRGYYQEDLPLAGLWERLCAGVDEYTEAGHGTGAGEEGAGMSFRERFPIF